MTEMIMACDPKINRNQHQSGTMRYGNHETPKKKLIRSDPRKRPRVPWTYQEKQTEAHDYEASSDAYRSGVLDQPLECGKWKENQSDCGKVTCANSEHRPYDAGRTPIK